MVLLVISLLFIVGSVFVCMCVSLRNVGEIISMWAYYFILGVSLCSKTSCAQVKAMSINVRSSLTSGTSPRDALLAAKNDELLATTSFSRDSVANVARSSDGSNKITSSTKHLRCSCCALESISLTDIAILSLAIAFILSLFAVPIILHYAVSQDTEIIINF